MDKIIDFIKIRWPRLVLFLIALYVIGVMFGEQLQMIMTFPQIGYQEVQMSGVEKIYLENENGDEISGVYMDGGSDQVVFYMHGNGGHIDAFANDIKYISQLWYNVLSFDYPGYGESEGWPIEQDVYDSAKTFYDYLIQEKEYSWDDIVVWGYSIGSAVGVDLAQNRDVSKFVLVSPITSRYDVARDMFGFELPRYLFLENSFESIDKISDVDVPTMIVHCQDDDLIPFEMWKSIFQNSPSNQKHLLALEGVGHNGILLYYGDELGEYFSRFLDGDELSEYIEL